MKIENRIVSWPKIERNSIFFNWMIPQSSLVMIEGKSNFTPNNLVLLTNLMRGFQFDFFMSNSMCRQQIAVDWLFNRNYIQFNSLIELE